MHIAKTVAHLNGKVQFFGQAPVQGSTSTPGQGPVRDSDVGGALARTDSLAGLLGRVKYAQQSLFITALVDAFTRQALITAKRERWKQPPHQLREVCVLVLEEYLNPRLCWQCHGRGHHMRRALRVTCQRCGGDGRLDRSDRWRARRAAMNRYQWTKWAQRYGQLLAMLRDLDDALHTELRYQL